MCIAITKEEGVDLPKEQYLRNCEQRNKDGMGIAYIKAGTSEIVIKKDFANIDVFVKWFYDNIKKEDTCLIHFRFATHGLIDVGNRHPFPVTKNKDLLRQAEVICQMAMVHNGVISEYGHSPKYSDTQKFVLDILSDDLVKQNLENPTVRKLIRNFLGRDRLAILTKDKKIYLWGEWEKDADIWYSNSAYKEEIRVIRGFAPYEWGKSLNSYQDNYVGKCDSCGQEKHCRCVDDEYNLFLCKSCRKKYKKGKLDTSKLLPILEDNFGNTDKFGALAESQCENCYKWVHSSEITQYFGAHICWDCAKQFNE